MPLISARWNLRLNTLVVGDMTKKIRQCTSGHLNTGTSKCPIDWDKVEGAIAVKRGVKLPGEITAEELARLCHADGDGRIYPIFPFVEYAKTGGDPQASANGYGPVGVTGVDARTDAFTMDKFHEALNASLLRNMNMEMDVYYWDKKKVLHGYNDGTDVLAGIPMSTIYPTNTPYGTSSAAAAMIVNFCHEDARDSQENFDYVVLDFNPKNAVVGLTAVELVSVGEGTYKIVEKVGGYDRTPEFGEEIAANAEALLVGATSATYKDGILTITSSGSVKLAAPSVLFENGIKGIEQL